jgi:hypothetical protein
MLRSPADGRDRMEVQRMRGLIGLIVTVVVIYIVLRFLGIL